jgi:hypothetical protein
MKNLIGNDFIWDFIIQRQYRYYDAEYYRYLISLMVNWKPVTPQADDIVYNGGSEKEYNNDDITMRFHQIDPVQSQPNKTNQPSYVNQFNQVHHGLRDFNHNTPLDKQSKWRGD